MTSRRPSGAFLTLVRVVIVAAIGVRLALLGRQSYWLDEIFSVNESAGSLRHLLQVASTEVHTPLYAGLLWIWMAIGGTGEVWTRLLSTLFTVAAVVVTHRGLRSVGIDEQVRLALTVATAAGGTSIVYSLETRNYALLMLGAVGLTVATVRAGLVLLDGDDVPRRTYLAWTGWSLLAATTHLFGAALTLAAAALLAVLAARRSPRDRVRRALRWAVLAAAGCALQAAWLLRGLGEPAFAADTTWIQAPRADAVGDLVTTTFAAGAMTPHKDGFAWASPLGVIAAVALVLVAALAGHRYRPTPGTAAGQAPGTAEGRIAGILLALVVIVVVPAFVISQWVHLWTLRNLVIIAPALVWGVTCLAAAAARTPAGHRRVATVAVVLLGAALVPIATGAARPYKADHRGLLEYLIKVRAAEADAGFAFLGPKTTPRTWQVASHRPAGDPAWDTLYRRATWYPDANAYPGPPDTPASSPQIVVYFHGVANPGLDAEADALVVRLGADRCRRIPIHGLIVARCD